MARAAGPAFCAAHREQFYVRAQLAKSGDGSGLDRAESRVGDHGDFRLGMSAEVGQLERLPLRCAQLGQCNEHILSAFALPHIGLDVIVRCHPCEPCGTSGATRMSLMPAYRVDGLVVCYSGKPGSDRPPGRVEHRVAAPHSKKYVLHDVVCEVRLTEDTVRQPVARPTVGVVQILQKRGIAADRQPCGKFGVVVGQHADGECGWHSVFAHFADPFVGG
jgi:hypothetical protein